MEFEIDLISKKRNKIMGFAAILILLCHNTVHFDSVLLGYLNKLIIQNGCQIGVDIFLFCSALGCTFSFAKNSDIVTFYKKRIIRIVPVYLSIILPWGFVCIMTKSATIQEVLIRYSFVGFFINGSLDEWYIIASIILYILFPMLFWLYKKDAKNLVGGSVAIVLLSVALPSLTNNSVLIAQNAVFYSRIPIFILGIFCADACMKKKTIRISKLLHAVFFIGGVTGYIVSNLIKEYNILTHFWFIPIVLSIVVYLVKEKSKFEKMYFFLAPATLEIYLLQDKIRIMCETIAKRLFEINFFMTLILNSVAIMITILAGVLFHRVYSRCVLIKKRG